MLRILPALIVNMHKKIRISCLQRNCSVIISVKHIFFGNIPNYDKGTVLPGIVPIRIFWRLRQNKAEVTAMSIFEYDEEGVRKMWQEDAREEGLAEGRAEGLQQGIQQGREQGEKQYLIQMVLRKLQKGKSAELIAEELEENPETVAHICTAAEKCATMTDTERVYEYLNNNIG